MGTFSQEDAEAAKVVLDYAERRRLPEKSGLRLAARREAQAQGIAQAGLVREENEASPPPVQHH